jgi:pyruvate, water dikinase
VRNSVCWWFEDLTREYAAVAGGKGANLGDMSRAGLPIPRGFVISNHAYKKTLATSRLNGEVTALLESLDPRDVGQLQEGERRIRSLFNDLPISEAFQRLIGDHYRALGTDAMVAVRSSATAEDLVGASFAGQQETILNVCGEAELMEAIRRCWSSLFTCQAIFYRSRIGFRNADLSMAIVVQKMVDSAKAGVIFTMDPVMKNRYVMIVEAVWGLGEGIVSGTITPDHYRVDRETCELLSERISEKRTMFCRDGGYGAAQIPVPDEKVSMRVLEPHELRQLVTLGDRVERHFGSPQDIEWGIDGEAIYLLQSRPVTSL